MGLDEQITEPEYVSKKHILANRKTELRANWRRLSTTARIGSNRSSSSYKRLKAPLFWSLRGIQKRTSISSEKSARTFRRRRKTLSVEFKNPWNIVADFNSQCSPAHAACSENSQISNWRRGRDSNPRAPKGKRFSRPPHSTTLPPLRFEQGRTPYHNFSAVWCQN